VASVSGFDAPVFTDAIVSPQLDDCSSGIDVHFVADHSQVRMLCQ